MKESIIEEASRMENEVNFQENKNTSTYQNSKIKNFEYQLLSEIKSQSQDILKNIVSSVKLDDANEKKLKDFIDNFKKEFLN